MGRATQQTVQAEGLSPLTDHDLYLFHEGTHCRLYEKMGAQYIDRDGIVGTHFAVWAPNAERVSVIGDFNHWNGARHPLRIRGSSGVWEGFVPGIAPGALYKYRIHSRERGYVVDKTDPFGLRQEVPPKTASVVHRHCHDWADRDWMAKREAAQSFDRPISVYELHLGSWIRSPDTPDRWLGYRELAPRLAEYCKSLGFTHVELLPVMEHPLYRSWGYQTVGYFAPTSRYGTPEDFMYLVDTLHQAGIGVILDWVPSHFPSDEHGLGYFDGTHLFEHADPRLGFHPDWKSLIFNYGRHEIRSFLLSSAFLWLDRFHADGLRVDAVASMLYLDYSRQDGEWIPNRHGGRENIEAIHFLQQLNVATHRDFPGTITVAEESTSWPMVSRPVDMGGLGFDYKWDMGWMHDTLHYMQLDPVYRKFHHNELTFRGMYQFSENFMMPLSHDEVVHGKNSLAYQMPGDEWQRFANLRLLLANQWTNPGKKLLFMGCEIGQTKEWDHDASIDWHLLEWWPHSGLQKLVRQLNRIYRDEPALHSRDCHPGGFEWVNSDDWESSTLVYIRRGVGEDEMVCIAANYTPVARDGYAIGLPKAGRWTEILNTDAEEFGGSGAGNLGEIMARKEAWGRFQARAEITIPPLGLVVFRYNPADL